MNALNPHRAYELWAETYPASAHNPLMQAEEAIVERLLRHIPARRALDVGTGSGRYLPILAATSAAVVGVDRSMAMLGRADRARLGQSIRPIRAVCGDACFLPFRRGTFDLINASLMVGDVANLAAWAAEMARVLSPAGHLVYSDFHQSWSENGWQRTFRSADGALHAVAFEPHTIENHLDALQDGGFHVLAIREPRLKVGRRESPVLAVFHAVKDGGLLR